MGTAKRTTKKKAVAAPTQKPQNGKSARTAPEVVTFMRELDHPMKKEIEVLRKIILEASPEIREGIKWNAPSYRTTEDFVTMNLRTKGGVRLIFHMGAKATARAKSGVEIADPEGLLEWLAKDRCLVSLADAKDIRAKRASLQEIVRAWMAQLP